MSVLVLTRIPVTWDESAASRVTTLAGALREHFRDEVDVQNRWPAPEIRVNTTKDELENAALLYCPGAGISYRVET